MYVYLYIYIFNTIHMQWHPLDIYICILYTYHQISTCIYIMYLERTSYNFSMLPSHMYPLEFCSCFIQGKQHGEPWYIYIYNWAVLSDEQMGNEWPFSLLNDEQMSNWVGVEHLPDKVYDFIQPKTVAFTKDAVFVTSPLSSFLDLSYIFGQLVLVAEKSCTSW